MIAHYGYSDAEGEFYLRIDTQACAACPQKPCIAACPRGLFVPEEDPYGEPVVAVAQAFRRSLKDECAACKPSGPRPPLPCVAACPRFALTHSW